MGIGRAVQWAEHITTTQLAERFGMRESISNLLTLARLRWLGHVACVSDNRMPKRILFGWLPQKHPVHGVKLRWRDKVRQDFKSLSINDSLWYQQAQDRSLWKQLCNAGMENLLTVPQSHHSFHCLTCRRSFRRNQDIAWHKCVTTQPQCGRR